MEVTPNMTIQQIPSIPPNCPLFREDFYGWCFTPYEHEELTISPRGILCSDYPRQSFPWRLTATTPHASRGVKLRTLTTKERLIVSSSARYAWADAAWRDVSAEACHLMVFMWQSSMYSNGNDEPALDRIFEGTKLAFQNQWKRWGRGENWQ